MTKNRITLTDIVILAAAVFVSGAVLVGSGIAADVPTKDVVHQTSVPYPNVADLRVPGHNPLPKYTPADSITTTAAPSVSASTTTNFTVVSTATMPFSATLTPPNFTGIFRIIAPAHGYIESGTKYLITHSMAKGSGAPGNLWETFKVGYVITYQGVQYRINYVATPAQGAIASEPIWGAQDPNELVMITCKSRGTAATNNYVIRAERI